MTRSATFCGQNNLMLSTKVVMLSAILFWETYQNNLFPKINTKFAVANVLVGRGSDLKY